MDNTRSDLDYKQQTNYQGDIVNYFSEYIRPRHIHDDNTSCVLEIAGSAFSCSFDECVLSVSYKVERKGPNGWVKLEHRLADGTVGPDATVAPIQNILESLFTQYDVVCQNKVISESTGIYPYTAYLVKLLNYSRDAKDTYLTLSGWESDTSNSVDDTTVTNLGFKKRRDRILNSREDTVVGVLYSDLAYALAMVPSHTDITLVLHKAKPEFVLQGGASAITYRVNITNVELEARKYELSPKLNQTIEKQLSTTGSIPFKHLSTTNHYVPIGSSTFQINRLVLGQLPLRIVFGIVENDTFSGDVEKSPYNFKRHGVTEYQLAIDGRTVPQRPVQVTNFIEPYLNLFRHTGQFCTNQTSGITFDQFKDSYCLHVINLRGDQDNRTDIYPHRARGTMSLRINFEDATTEGLTIVVLAEYENTYLIDRLRNITSDHSIH